MQTKSRHNTPAAYPARFPVPNGLVAWETHYEVYSPVYFTDDKVLQEKGADPEEVSQVKHQYRSYTGQVEQDAAHYPLNPMGRTGLRGRGSLHRWGANFAADAIITRPGANGGYQLLAVQRKVGGQWGLPGGMVDKGETDREAAQRELKEESGAVVNLDNAIQVYQGYVDDERNTDNAWMETTAFHKHLSAGEAAKVKIEPGYDEVLDAKWQPVTDEFLNSLYASHGDMVRLALERMP